MTNNYQIGSIVFGSWTIKRKIGEGSFGKVFEIQREDFGEVYKAALKVITVPQSEAEVQSAMEEGMSRQQAEQYFYGVVEDIVREFAIMAKLKGTANVVGYEDHAVIRHKDGIGWDILIRMELLNPLLPYAYAHPFARRDIIRLGIDICKALELCQKYNVIHRDIKPENIFVSDNGDFKLGDFGIARTIDRTMSGLSKKGTYNYMAPEVYRGAEYGFSVDLYSLGIVLYRMLNKNRVPFLPPPPEPITFHSRELALAKRMGGEEMPAPVYAQGRLAEIIQKACAFDPKQRYSSPAQMRQELEAILYDEADAALIYPDGDELALMENQYASRTPEPEEQRPVSVTADDKTASMFGGSASGGFDSSRTESMFGGAAADGFETSRTEGVFGQNIPQEEGTSKTESIFGKTPVKEQPKRPAPAAKKPGEKKKTVAIVAAGGLVLAIAGGVLLMNHQRAQEKQAWYAQEMQAGTEVCAEDPEAALLHFKQADILFPEETAPKVSYAYALYCNRQYEDCITYIEDDLALGKAYDISVQSQLSEILGAAYFEQKDYAQAASFFRLSTAGGDITVSAQRDYAVSLGRLKDFDAADQVLQEMIAAGADDVITAYVQAEVDYAREEYLDAESGFLAALELTSDRDLKNRAMRSLAELYMDCSSLVVTGNSPIDQPATKAAELIQTTVSDLGIAYEDAPLQELWGQAYYEAYHVDHGYARNLENAASCFERAIELGGPKEYLYRNIYTAYYEYIKAGNYSQPSYEQAENALAQYKDAFPSSYIPYALETVHYINIENEKPQEQRDYSKAQLAYQIAQDMVTGSDDTTYLQMVESLFVELERNGWL